MPRFQHDSAFKMSQSYISVCIAPLLVMPCCDRHEIMTQNPSERVKAFSTLHNHNNHQE